jgi:hypothetical protein
LAMAGYIVEHLQDCSGFFSLKVRRPATCE